MVGDGGGGWGMVGVGELALPLGTGSGSVLLVGDRDVQNPQYRLKWPLTAAWHPT